MTIDIELTNRCNSSCSFCPRDAMPHQGMMAPSVFAEALARAVELRAMVRRMTIDDEPRVVFCGTGEALLHPQHAEFVRHVTRAGFACTVSTNGALLDAHAAGALLDAGLAAVAINASALGDDYERIYGLPFARTRDNIARFVELAKGRCEVFVVVVDHASDAGLVGAVTDYWRRLGVERFIRYDLVNRAGSLKIDDLNWQKRSEHGEARTLLAARNIDPVCAAPFVHPYIGYDGLYYLCSSDWQKEVPLGSVLDTSFAATMVERIERVLTRKPICERCSIDPVNQLTSLLSAVRSGRADREAVDVLITQLEWTDGYARRIARETRAQLAGPRAAAFPSVERDIPARGLV